jgi:hypothetical protein
LTAYFRGYGATSAMRLTFDILYGCPTYGYSKFALVVARLGNLNVS